MTTLTTTKNDESKASKRCKDMRNASEGEGVGTVRSRTLRRREKPCPEGLPCPWCGATPTIMPWHGGGPRKRRIGCPDDGSQCPVVPSTSGSNRARAIQAWNARAEGDGVR